LVTPRPILANRLTPFGTTIFTEMTLLANKHGAVNLAQGFPDFDGPDFIKQAAIEAIRTDAPGHNQYARMFGIPKLNAAIAAGWQQRTGQALDPDTQVTVTSGCTEAVCAAMLALLNPGDEIILFEPYYDSYRACAAMAGATPRFVTLHAPTDGCRGLEALRKATPIHTHCTPLAGECQFWFEPKQLAAAFTPKTRAILVNTPHNPTGKVFTREELKLIADLCIRHDVIAITDEVYEHLTYDLDLPHISIATLPGMAERTLTLSSLGKSFSLTGWKIGWAIGSPELSKAIRAAHQFITFATATPLQHGAAAAAALSQEATVAIGTLRADLARNREFLGKVLEDCGFEVYPPAGAYFILANWTRVPKLSGLGITDDTAFCKHLTESAGVAAIPPSVFYENKQHGRPLARFAFCKKMSTLEEAAKRLKKWAKEPLA
jgi:aspartate/methionine/tyrosine aminotransferase